MDGWKENGGKMKGKWKEHEGKIKGKCNGNSWETNGNEAMNEAMSGMRVG